MIRNGHRPTIQIPPSALSSSNAFLFISFRTLWTQWSTRKSFPLNHFRILSHAMEGWGASTAGHFKYHLNSGSLPSYAITPSAANSCICHTSGESPVSPIIATDPKAPFRKSFACHTYDPLPPFPTQGKQDERDGRLRRLETQGQTERSLIMVLHIPISFSHKFLTDFVLILLGGAR